MNGDQARALAVVAVLWSGVSGSAGFVGGRMSAPIPPAEVRYVPAPAPAEVAPADPVSTGEMVAAPVAPAPVVEPKPLPPKKVEAKAHSRAQPKPVAREVAPRKPRPAKRSSLPSCAFIKREYARMTFSERMAEYRRATPEQIAHGKRCLGM